MIFESKILRLKTGVLSKIIGVMNNCVDSFIFFLFNQRKLMRFVINRISAKYEIIIFRK